MWQTSACLADKEFVMTYPEMASEEAGSPGYHVIFRIVDIGDINYKYP